MAACGNEPRQASRRSHCWQLRWRLLPRSLLGVVRARRRPLAASIGQALSGAFGPGAPTAPGLDPLERVLLDGATSPGADGPTLLDLRTQLRSRLERPIGRRRIRRDPAPARRSRAFGAVDRGGPAATSRSSTAATEDAWLRDALSPGSCSSRFREFAAGIAGKPGAVVSLVREPASSADERGWHRAGPRRGRRRRAGLDGGRREVVLRRRSGSGPHGHRRARAAVDHRRHGCRDHRRRSGLGRVRRLLGLAAVLGAALALIAGTTTARRGARRTRRGSLAWRGHRPAPLSVSAADIADVAVGAAPERRRADAGRRAARARAPARVAQAAEAADAAAARRSACDGAMAGRSPHATERGCIATTGRTSP